MFPTPVRTLIAPCTALMSPLTSISMSSVNSCGHASGQSQWAMAEMAYATLERTLLMASRSPPGSSSRMAALAWTGRVADWFSEQRFVLVAKLNLMDRPDLLFREAWTSQTGSTSEFPRTASGWQMLAANTSSSENWATSDNSFFSTAQ